MDKYINEYREKVHEHLVGIGIDQNELIDDFLEERNFLQTLDKQRASDIIALAHQTCAINLSGEQERIKEHYEDLVLNNDIIIKKYYGNAREVSNLIDPKYPLDDWGKDSQYWVKWLTQHQEKLFILQKYINCIEQDLNKINWCKSEEVLRQLIDALKENELIQQRETDSIIQHFNVSGKEPVQVELSPISWLKTKALLAYFIRRLHTSNLINVDNLWHEMEPHFLINGKAVKELRKSEASTYGNLIGSDIIDKLIKYTKQ